MKKQKMTISNLFVVIMGAFLVAIPWVSHLKFWKLSEAMTYIFSNTDGIYTEFFMYYKELAVIFAGIMILSFFISELWAGKKNKSPILLLFQENRWIPVCVAAFLGTVIVSALCAKDPATVLMGIPTEGEGVFTFVSYMLLFLGFYNFLREERDWKTFQYALRILMVLTILLTCIEFFYLPLFEIPFFRNLLAGAEYRNLLEGMENVSFRNFVVLTFSNPNYFGGFCLLLIPFAMKDLLQSNDIRRRIGYGFWLAGLYFCVIAAKSTASFYLGILEGVMFFGITWITEKKRRRELGLNAGVFLLSFGFVFLAAFAINGEKLERVSVSAAKNQRWQELKTAKYELSDIKLEDNQLLFYIGEKVLTAASSNGSVTFFDTAGEQIPIQVRSNSANAILLELESDEFEGITVEITGNQFAFDFGYENPAYFLAIEDAFYGMGQNGQLLRNVSLGNMSERFGTEMYGWVTGRGYAWVNTLPILKETLLIGKGAGNFPLYFPQYDYVGLLNTHGSHELVADKPHCMYLQIAVDHGIIGLFAVLGLFACGVVLYLKNRFKYNIADCKAGMADAAFTVLIAFMLYSSCNDSTVAVSPVFWMIYGSLFAALTKIRAEMVVHKK